MLLDSIKPIPPCVLHEDEHILVVNKPAGWNTHAPSPHAGEGIYEWLKHREARWTELAIIHRLDKETSGVMVFGKTAVANRSLTEQFAGREVKKKYVLLSDRAPKEREFIAKSKIVRAGEKYVSGAAGDAAETRFTVRATDANGRMMVEAQPMTGRTHQIRVHAAESGFPIFGDTLYGGAAFARVCLHAAEISFKHPARNEEVTFEAPVNFEGEARAALREAIIESAQTNAYRMIHGASDGWPGWYVDRLGEYVLSQADGELTQQQLEHLAALGGTRAAYHKVLNRQVRKSSAAEASPKLVRGEAAPERFVVKENGVQFELSFDEGYSVGLFFDQRDNRRRFLTRHVAAGFELKEGPLEVLNTFAYTCGFSVCAAMAGARTTSLDLSKKYLEWGKRNFAVNGIDATMRDFIYGDTFDWLKRLAKKQRAFDVVVMDPPTFSQSKESGVFRAEKDYGKLVAAALPVLKREGVLLASTNAAEWSPEDFLARVGEAIGKSGRKILQQHYVPQPPDFPVSRAEPAYLKTLWLRVG